MKKTIILNQTDLHTVIDASSRLIVWAHETCKLNKKDDTLFTIKLRLPHSGEVNTGGMPPALCSQRVLEMTLDGFDGE